jgi:hypothetical protein
MITTSPKRHWYQFSLKALLVIVTLTCVGMGWLAYERNEVRRHEAAIAAIKKLRGGLKPRLLRRSGF